MLLCGGLHVSSARAGPPAGARSSCVRARGGLSTVVWAPSNPRHPQAFQKRLGRPPKDGGAMPRASLTRGPCRPSKGPTPMRQGRTTIDVRLAHLTSSTSCGGSVKSDNYQSIRHTRQLDIGRCRGILWPLHSNIPCVARWFVHLLPNSHAGL